MDKGYIIHAQNTEKVNYVRCAEVLAMSIKKVMPDSRISVITDDDVSKPELFDKIISLPYGDQDPEGNWKLNNDWQVYEATPYEYTIKLEADMYIPRSIEHWWDVLKHRDLVVSTTVRNFKQEISNVRAYRRFIDDNKFPDCYNAITYFKKSETAKDFFGIVRNVFNNWEEHKTILKCNKDEPVSTDWAYAIASHILTAEKTTLPDFTEMSMVHMKQFVNGMPTENWTDTLVYEILPHALRINTFPQKYPFHYHIKDFSTQLMDSLK